MNKTMFAAILAAGILSYSGYMGMTLLMEKAAQQQAETEVVQRWKNSYQALGKSRTAWERRYPSLSKYNDLLALFRSLSLARYGLSADPDQLSVLKVENVQHNGMSVGLTRVCVGSSGAASNAGLLVNASGYSALLDGVSKLAARKDIEMSAITVSSDAAGAPQATIGDFCMLLRNGGQA